MKYTLLIDSLVSGGAQRQILFLGHKLCESGAEVTFVTYNENSELEYLVDDAATFRCIELKKHSKMRFLFRLYRYFRIEKPDVIIAYLFFPSLLARLIGRAAGVRMIVTSERNLDLDKSWSRLMIERATCRLSSVIVTNAYSTRNRLLELLPVSNTDIEVIYNAVDHQRFYCATPDMRGQARALHGLNSDDFIFMLPGRMVAQKDHMTLLRASSQILDKYNFKLVFVGNEIDKDIRGMIQSWIDASGMKERVQFLGFQKDMFSMYGLADIVVLPSLWEGLPNVVLEAMACEKPVIVSNVSDNPQLVTPQNGMIFNPGDVDGLASAMSAMLTLSNVERVGMGRASRQLSKALCSQSSFVAGYRDLILRKSGGTT